MNEKPKIDYECSARIDFASTDKAAGGVSRCRSFGEPECYLLYLRNNGFYAQVFENECLLRKLSPEIFNASDPDIDQPENPFESATHSYWKMTSTQ